MTPFIRRVSLHFFLENSKTFASRKNLLMAFWLKNA